MKKLRMDNGGYALLYVLIIILVLCAIAMAICTVALQNFQAQERSVAQMQQLYQAEGEIEKFVALAEDVGNMHLGYDSTTKSGAMEKYKEHVVSFLEIGGPCEGCEVTPHCNEGKCQFDLTSSDKSVQTSIEMVLKYDEDIRNEGTDEEPNYVTYYKVSTASHIYLSYTITHLNEEGSGGT